MAEPNVIPCADLAEALEFFVERLGFRLDVISPADDPRRALISGHGVHLELRRERAHPPAATLSLGPQDIIVTRVGDGSGWVTGRAGMRYHDLIPGRLGGRFIASRIRIDDGGPVPDSVHFHDIRFQMIYCVAGWVRVLYEDQGAALMLKAGDCFLQPPRIRHRVLECSAGLEVIEIASPAEHDTFFDHELELPTRTLRPERDFGGQRFVFHEAAAASWERLPCGFELRDTGIGDATGRLAGARVWRSNGSPAHSWQHAGEFLFLHLLTGEVTIHCSAREPMHLSAGDSVVVPAGVKASARGCSVDVQILEVCLPCATRDPGRDVPSPAPIDP